MGLLTFKSRDRSVDGNRATGRFLLTGSVTAKNLDGEDYYSRLKKTPKHYLADTAFAVQLLDIGIDALLGKDKRHSP
ncbi:MAG: hypothetical protein LBK67_08235 [Coriobacteriales bacterium]|nr:hypothetical protein [Coriobacteriales bacterium]